MLRNRTILALITAVAAVVVAIALASPTEASRKGKQIKILDDCDPASFNAAVGDGTCVGKGKTTFDDFLAEIAATQAAADWRFKPSMLKVKDGRPVILENRGGETHTFTMVKAFGGGFIPILNQLSGNPDPAMECVDPNDATLPSPPSPVNVFVAAGKDEAFSTAGLKPGRYMFQCCIHPWMRVVLTVRKS